MTWRPEGWETVLVGTRIYKGELLRNTTDAFEAGADAIIDALSSEIEKVENPYCAFPGSFEDEHEGFENCRQAILSVLCGLVYQ